MKDVASIQLLDLTGSGLLKRKTLPYCNADSADDNNTPVQLKFQDSEITSVQAAAEMPLEHGWSVQVQCIASVAQIY